MEEEKDIWFEPGDDSCVGAHFDYSVKRVCSKIELEKNRISVAFYEPIGMIEFFFKRDLAIFLRDQLNKFIEATGPEIDGYEDKND